MSRGSPQRRLLIALVWAVGMAAILVLNFHVRQVDDGDSALVFRFHSGTDLAFAIGMVAAITIEARRAFIAAIEWWAQRLCHDVARELGAEAPR